jgi:hypothetical protein
MARNFVRALDETTRAAHGHAWVEKTPIHLHRISLIERYVKDARFVHILRSGLPAIASLYSMTNEYPEQWGSRTLDECVVRWQEDVRLSSNCVSRNNHAFVSYERLVENVSQTLVRLSSWLTLRTDRNDIASMIASYKTKSSQVIDNEPWKEGVSSSITNRNNFWAVDGLWTEEEQVAMRRRLAAESQLLESLPYM